MDIGKPERVIEVAPPEEFPVEPAQPREEPERVPEPAPADS